jgi:hypothetical protein
LYRLSGSSGVLADNQNNRYNQQQASDRKPGVRPQAGRPTASRASDHGRSQPNYSLQCILILGGEFAQHNRLDPDKQDNQHVVGRWSLQSETYFGKIYKAYL